MICIFYNIIKNNYNIFRALKIKAARALPAFTQTIFERGKPVNKPQFKNTHRRDRVTPRGSIGEKRIRYTDNFEFIVLTC